MCSCVSASLKIKGMKSRHTFKMRCVHAHSCRVFLCMTILPVIYQFYCECSFGVLPYEQCSFNESCTCLGEHGSPPHWLWMRLGVPGALCLCRQWLAFVCFTWAFERLSPGIFLWFRFGPFLWWLVRWSTFQKLTGQSGTPLSVLYLLSSPS